MRPNKLEGLQLETLSSQVLDLRARPEQTPLEDLSDASFLGKLPVLPAIVRLDWKVFARHKHYSLFGLVISNKEKKFYTIDTRVTGILIEGAVFDGVKLSDSSAQSPTLSQVGQQTNLYDSHRYNT
jgi:hypothetical protein